MVSSEILTLKEVAALLKVAEKTVYTMAQRAELPAFKVRGQWRFKLADIDRWIDRQKAASGTSGAARKSTNKVKSKVQARSK